MRSKGKKGGPARMSEVEYAAYLARTTGVEQAPKPSKHRNVKATANGIKFDSQGERDRYLILVDFEKRGIIADLKTQVRFVLSPSVDLGEKRRKAPLRYYADFAYTIVATGEYVVEDFKGNPKRTASYRSRKHLMMDRHSILIKETNKKTMGAL